MCTPLRCRRRPRAPGRKRQAVRGWPGSPMTRDDASRVPPHELALECIHGPGKAHLEQVATGAIHREHGLLVAAFGYFWRLEVEAQLRRGAGSEGDPGDVEGPAVLPFDRVHCLVRDGGMG